MNQSTSASLVAILVFFAGGYWMLNDFKTPRVFWGETAVSVGIVTERKLIPGLKGIGFIQLVTYVFPTKDGYVKSRENIKRTIRKQVIGNSVKVEYSINDPSKNELKGFANNFSGTEGAKVFLQHTDYGKKEIKMINYLFFLDEIDGKGKVKNLLIGGYHFQGDSLLIEPYINTLKYDPVFQVKLNSFKDTTLINLVTRKIYY